MFAVCLPAYNNPLLDEYNKLGLQRLTKEPKDDLPPLLELSARAVYNHGIEHNTGCIPQELEGMENSGLTIVLSLSMFLGDKVLAIKHILCTIFQFSVQTSLLFSSAVVSAYLFQLWGPVLFPLQIECLLSHGRCLPPSAAVAAVVLALGQQEMCATRVKEVTHVKWREIFTIFLDIFWIYFCISLKSISNTT